LEVLLNYDSTAGTVTNSTYISFIVIMAAGWLLGAFICPPSVVRMKEIEVETEKSSIKSILKL